MSVERRFGPWPPNSVVLVETPRDDLIRQGAIGVYPSPHVLCASLISWQQYLNTWSVKGNLPVQITAHDNGPCVFIEFMMVSHDARLRFTTNPIELQVTLLVPTAQPGRGTAEWIRAVLRWMYCHELDEWIKVDDERVFDPHAHGATPTPENS